MTERVARTRLTFSPKIATFLTTMVILENPHFCQIYKNEYICMHLHVLLVVSYTVNISVVISDVQAYHWHLQQKCG